MNTLRPHLRRLSTIALLAIFALALMPTLSRLLAHSTGNSAWVEVCTPQGLKQLAVADDGVTVKPVSPAMLGLSHLDHCPLCGLGSAVPPLPPALATWALPEGAREGPPPLFAAAPRPLFAWATARPRGPPTQA